MTGDWDDDDMEDLDHDELVDRCDALNKALWGLAARIAEVADKFEKPASECGNRPVIKLSAEELGQIVEDYLENLEDP